MKLSSFERISLILSLIIKLNFNFNMLVLNWGIGGVYIMDDGYVFSLIDVIEDIGDVFVVLYGNYFYYIFKSDLLVGELAAV